MKIAFDSNVLLDAIANRADYEDAQALIMAVADEKIDGIVTANSITDIYYVTKKYLSDTKARAAILNLLTVFDIAAVGGTDCANALNVAMSDYEDALLAVCASREKADYIVTRDEGFLSASSPVSAKRPKEILNMIA